MKMVSDNNGYKVFQALILRQADLFYYSEFNCYCNYTFSCKLLLFLTSSIADIANVSTSHEIRVLMDLRWLFESKWCTARL